MSKRRPPPLPPYPHFVFAPSHRKEQRHNSHVPATTGTGERGGSGREPRGEREEDIAAASHAHMHKSVGRNASSYPARPHVVKRSRFLCLSLHKKRWRRQRGQAGDSFSRPVFFHFSHLVLSSKSVESLKSSQDFARACNKYEQECTGESLRKRISSS